MSYPPPGGYQGGGYPPPPSPTSGKTKTLGLDFNLASLLCYMCWCCCIGVIASILWLATEPKENKFLRFHAWQALFLVGVWFVVEIVLFVIGLVIGVGSGMMRGGGLPGGGFGMALLLVVFHWGIRLIFFIIHVVAMIKAYGGQTWKLPIIGDLAEKNS